MLLSLVSLGCRSRDYAEWTDTYNGMNGDIPVTVYVKPSQINKVEGTFVHVKAGNCQQRPDSRDDSYENR